MESIAEKGTDLNGIIVTIVYSKQEIAFFVLHIQGGSLELETLEIMLHEGWTVLHSIYPLPIYFH